MSNESNQIDVQSPSKFFPLSRGLSFSYSILILISVISVSLDQWTKGLVRQSLSFGEVFTPWPDAFPAIRIVHWGNEGAAFGLFQGGGAFFTILAIAVALLIIFYFPSIDHQNWLIRIAMGLQLGGAMGNMIDRLRIGYVTDWLAVSNFPVFNVADSSITLGAISLILFTWILDRREKEEATASEADSNV
jgi:signal peptidase II